MNTTRSIGLMVFVFCLLAIGPTRADEPAKGNTPGNSDSTVAPPTPAAETTPTNTPADKPFDLRTTKQLTGDWGGVRTELADRGITFKLTYLQQFQQNFRGGLETHNGHRFSGSYDLDIAVDFGKLGWMDDAGFFIRAAKGTWSDGINPDKVGALGNTNSDAGDDKPVIVSKWWLWKKFANKKIELRLGLLETAKDLIDVSLYANHEDIDFINRFSIRNATIPHRTGLGVFLKFELTTWSYVQLLGVDNQYKRGKTGFDSAFHDESQFVGYLEAGLKPTWESSKGPMPMVLRGGCWYDPTTKTVFRNTLGGRREAERDTGDVGYYFGVDQLVWKEQSDAKDKQGLGLFARYGHAHADRNRITDYWSAGASYLGLIPTRDADVVGFGCAQAILAKRYRDDVHPTADRETVYEWYYSCQVTPWCVVSPHVQFITNPGGDKDDRDAVVGGMRLRISF